MSRMVVLVGARMDAGQVIRTALGDRSLDHAIRAGMTVSLLSWAPASQQVEGIEDSRSVGGSTRVSATDRVLAALRADSLASTLARFPVGRLVNSLAPWDQSRVFWRAVRRDPHAMAMLRGATLLVAADLPAVRTAWNLRHSGAVQDAYFGLPAALELLSGRAAG